jgi:hypothetical protein
MRFGETTGVDPTFVGAFETDIHNRATTGAE